MILSWRSQLESGQVDLSWLRIHLVFLHRYVSVVLRNLRQVGGSRGLCKSVMVSWRDPKIGITK